jgi:hypothetical protein
MKAAELAPGSAFVITTVEDDVVDAAGDAETAPVDEKDQIC